MTIKGAIKNIVKLVGINSQRNFKIFEEFLSVNLKEPDLFL